MTQLANWNGDDFRTLDMDGERWVMLTDVCRALDLQNPAHQASRMPEWTAKQAVGGGITNSYTGLPRWWVNRAGVFWLAFRSRKAQAERFVRWVCEEVLPSIQDTGSYSLTTSHDLAALLEDQPERVAKHLYAFVESLLPRRPPSKRTRQLHVTVCHERLGGYCPCCLRQRLIGDNGEALDIIEIDHFFTLWKAGPSHTWSVCAFCNQKLDFPGGGSPFRKKSQERFCQYQEIREAYLDGLQMQLPFAQPRKRRTAS